MAHRTSPLTVITALATALATLALVVAPASAHPTHEVGPGDTLSAIAKAHGLTTAELAAANGIADPNRVRVGQTLVVPNAAPAFHVVQPGETVSGIARRYQVSIAELVAINRITDPNRIRAGVQLELPSGARSDDAVDLSAIAARYPALPSSITRNPERLALVPSFERWAAHYGVPADLVMAMAYQESGWQADVVSSADAIGIGQLLPGTAEWVAQDLIGIDDLDPYDPDDNIRMSTRFLLWLILHLGGEDAALAGYYQGPTSYQVRGIFGETRVYVANVQAARWRFQPA